MLETPPLRVLLLGASFDTRNMGVGALASGAMRCLRTYGCNPDIRLLDYGTEDAVLTVDSDGHAVSIPVVCMRFSKKLYLGNNIVVLLLLAVLLRWCPSHKLRESILGRNKCLRHICEANLVAAVSGGDSFSDIYGLGRFLYVCLPQLLVLILDKDLVLLPQTLGPFSGRLPRLIARAILSRAERVYSRDHIGLQQLEQFLGRAFDAGRHRFCYDLGFVVEPRHPAKLEIMGLNESFATQRPLVGLNVSGLLWVGGYSRNNMFGLQPDYRQLVYAMIDHLISSKAADVLLVPHVFGKEPGSESDASACEEIFNSLNQRYKGRLALVRSSLDQCEIKYVIGQCDFFIGSRMHACIAALSQQIPALAVAYSNKFIGVLETLGVPSLVADARRFDTQEILTLLDASYDNRQEIVTYLAARIPDVQETVLRLCHDFPGSQTQTLNDAEPALSSH